MLNILAWSGAVLFLTVRKCLLSELITLLLVSNLTIPERSFHEQKLLFFKFVQILLVSLLKRSFSIICTCYFSFAAATSNNHSKLSLHLIVLSLTILERSWSFLQVSCFAFSDLELFS